jgi:hypothetical protein
LDIGCLLEQADGTTCGGDEATSCERPRRTFGPDGAADTVSLAEQFLRCERRQTPYDEAKVRLLIKRRAPCPI